MILDDAITDQVRDKYARAARSVLDGTASRSAQSAGCCSPAEGAGFGEGLYSAIDRASLSDAAVLASLGCGNPIAVADLHPGETVLDLGSAAGSTSCCPPSESGRRASPTAWT